jgi:hypothetical protein
MPNLRFSSFRGKQSMKLGTIVILLFATHIALAQRSIGSDNCEIPGGYEPWLAQPGGAGWYGGSSVTLFIVSPTTGGFTSGQQSDISTALGNWNSTVGSNLQITTSVVTSTPTSFPSQYILVQFGDTSGCGSGQSACTSFNYNASTGNSTYSTINIDSSAVGSNGILPLMAHEMGHTYLLADCPESLGCSSALTVMDNSINQSSPTTAQCCDEDILYFMTPTNPYGTLCGG